MHAVTVRDFDEAYEWLCRSRKQHPASSDIWDLRRKWVNLKESIAKAFSKGTYRFDVQSKMTLASGDTVAMWSSPDYLVLKVLTWIIQEKLKPMLSKACYHLKVHGGLKGAVRDVMKSYPDYSFFCKTDVRSYHDSIDHYTLMMRLHDHIKDRTVMGYVWQFLNRCVEWGGLYQDIRRGIPRGASLSPLLGAFYLTDLDHRMPKLDVKYFRYMDDILILACTRWKLKKAIRVLNRTFTELRLEKHPDKTDMGRIEKGFDFLGYHFSPHGLTLADKTVEKFLEKACRINAQKSPGLGKGELSDYVKRWHCWAYGGLAPCPNGRECRIHQEAPEGTKDIPHVPLRIQPSGFTSKSRSNDIGNGSEGGTGEYSPGVASRGAPSFEKKVDGG